MKPLSRPARGLAVALGLAVAASVLVAPAATAAETPAPQAADLCGLLPVPGCETVPLPDLPLPDLCLPTLPGIPLPPICLPGSGTTTAPNATTPVSITAPAAGAKTGQTLTAKPPVWDQPDSAVTTLYAWKRDGVAIPGATATTYKLVAADAGKRITVVATGATSSTTKTDSTSQPVTARKGDAPKPTSSPRISGTPAIGSTLSVTAGTWADPQPTFTYQWYRSRGRGVALISGATTTSYQPTAADAGRQLVVVVLAATPGYETGFGVSDLAAVPQLASRIVVTLVARTVTPNKQASMRIAVTADDGGVGGTVDVLDRGRRIATRTVQPGGSVVKLPRLPVGAHDLTAVFRGDTGHSAVTSSVVRLIVRRAR